jgi:hypothetical protein
MSDKVMIVLTPDQHFAEIGKSLVLQAPLENREAFTKRKSKLIIHQRRRMKWKRTLYDKHLLFFCHQHFLFTLTDYLAAYFQVAK